MKSPAPTVIFGLLALVMALTRFPPSAQTLHLYDASWAVFFAAGFYLTAQWRWAFPALMGLAVAVDYVAIQHMNISNYCVTLAYWFLVPTHIALWLGGAWLQQHAQQNLRGAALLIGSLWASASLAFLISNGSFYWIGSRVADPSWAGWIKNFSDWYPNFMLTTAGYVAVAVLAHFSLNGLRNLRRGAVT